METHAIHAAALALRIVPQALEAITAQVQTHFGDAQVKPQVLSDYLSSLPVWTKVGLSQEQFSAMPPTWRLQQGMAYQPPPTPRRPYRPAAPEDIRAQWAGLPLAEQATRYRAWCDEQARPVP